jgi:hypothetical protein
MPRIGTLISGVIAAMEGQTGGLALVIYKP